MKRAAAHKQAPRVAQQLSNEQISAMYSSIIHLCAQNKVTPQNAWSLQLIDHIDAVIDGEPQPQEQPQRGAPAEQQQQTDAAQSQRSTEHAASKTNFQLASCTLDASAQIYSARVDSVHKIAYEVLGGLSHAHQHDDDGDGGAGDDVDGDGDDDGSRAEEGQPSGDGTHTGGRAHARKERKAATTLDTPENLDNKSTDTASNANYLFRKTTAMMNRGGARSLFLNNCTALCGYEVLMEPKDVLAVEEGNKRLIQQQLAQQHNRTDTKQEVKEERDEQDDEKQEQKEEQEEQDEQDELKEEQEDEQKEKDEKEEQDEKKEKHEEQEQKHKQKEEDDDGDGYGAEDEDRIVEEPGKTVSRSDVLALLGGRDVDKLLMCSVFHDYSFAAGDIVRSSSGSAPSSQERAANALEIPDSPVPSAAFALMDEGDNGDSEPGLGDLLGGRSDDFDDFDDDADGAGDGLRAAGSSQQDDAEAEKSAQALRSEFTFFDPKMMRNWAGPGYWKFPTAQKKHGSDSNQQQQQQEGDERPGEAPQKKRARRSKDELFIDFTTPKKPLSRSLFEPPAKATTVLSDAALKKHSVEATTLPPDVHYDVSMLSRLFLNPDWHFTERHIAEIQRQEAADPAADQNLAGRLLQRGGPMSQEWYECREAGILPGASSGALLGSALGDDDDGGIDASGDIDFGVGVSLFGDAQQQQEQQGQVQQPQEGAEAATGAATGGLGELVQAPAMPQVTQVAYARTIKRMDAAAVKGALWKALCRLQPDTDGGEPAAEPVPFRALVAMLPSLLPPTVLAELTVAFCFVCLLHLCNERGVALSLEPASQELIASRKRRA